MPSQEKIQANRMMYTELLLTQVKPYLTAKPRVWGKAFGETVTFNDTFNMVAKARFLPFGKNEVPTDCKVFVNWPSILGDSYAVLNFAGVAVQPTDFIFILDQKIPRAAWLKKASDKELTDKWATALTENGEADPFASYLSNLERKTGILPDSPQVYANWVYYMGKLAIEVPFTMVLMPLGDGRTVFLFKRHYRPGFFSVKKTSFDVEKVWYVAEWVNEALTEFGYQGDPAPLEVPVGAVSLLALPEIAPMFEDQGRDIPCEMDLSQFNAPIVQPQPSAAPEAHQSPDGKFCINCGNPLPTQAVFCSKCGSKQA